MKSRHNSELCLPAALERMSLPQVPARGGQQDGGTCHVTAPHLAPILLWKGHSLRSVSRWAYLIPNTSRQFPSNVREESLPHGTLCPGQWMCCQCPQKPLCGRWPTPRMPSQPRLCPFLLPNMKSCTAKLHLLLLSIWRCSFAFSVAQSGAGACVLVGCMRGD